MSAFVFKIINSEYPNGIDILPFLIMGGLKWQGNDIDASGAGRTMDGTMHRAKVAEKSRWDCTCKPLTTEQTKILLNMIRPAYITVQITDPQDGLVTKRFYSNNKPASVMNIQEDGTALWTGIQFPLIEV